MMSFEFIPIESNVLQMFKYFYEKKNWKFSIFLRCNKIVTFLNFVVFFGFNSKVSKQFLIALNFFKALL